MLNGAALYRERKVTSSISTKRPVCSEYQHFYAPPAKKSFYLSIDEPSYL